MAFKVIQSRDNHQSFNVSFSVYIVFATWCTWDLHAQRTEFIWKSKPEETLRKLQFQSPIPGLTWLICC